MDFLRPVRLWIWFGTVTSLAGWTLSALGQLNRTGYVLFFGAALALWWWFQKSATAQPTPCRRPWRKFLRRFRRPLPGAFAVLVILIFLGGALYPPTNHTAFTYRLPRVLNWLEHGGWFWIHTPDWRLNDRACGIEWITAPLVLFTHSDRGLFLLNFVPYVLMPGLFFSLCRQLGVRARTAWHWMWLLPTGYSFLLQAGSAGNDIFPTAYALAALVFGLRAWKTHSAVDLWYSTLAAALLTGAKATNLPLLLPWAALVTPLCAIALKKWLRTSLVLVFAATVSFLPTAVLNHLYCGDWSGSVLEPAGQTMRRPLVGIWGNTFQILLDNFCPPVFPIAGWWNQHATQLLPQGLVETIGTNFDEGFFWLGELPTEDWAGIGFGISVLLALSLIAAIAAKSSQSLTPGNSLSPLKRGEGQGEGKLASNQNASSPQPSPPLGEERENSAAGVGRFCAPRWLRLFVLLSPWIGILVYCVKSGLVTAARLISPYYFVLWPSLILGTGHAFIVRRCWWQIASWAVVVMAFGVLIVTPPRPLWPAQTLLSAALKAKPDHRLLTRAYNVYAVYAIRSDPLAGVRPLLPADLKVTGFLGTPDDIDISFWRPYGTKRVEHILLDDPTDVIRSKGIEWAVVSGLHFQQRNTTLSNWLAQSGAELVTTTNITVKVADGPQPWHVVRFRKD
ncbi:MAG: hypothetical protein U1F65_11940 [Verrucomicrobiota bacterium]